MVKMGKLTGTKVPFRDPDGEIRGFRGEAGGKLRICVDAQQPLMMMSDAVSGNGSNYSSVLVCEKGTEITLHLYWDPPSHGMGVSVTNGDGVVFEVHNHNSDPWTQQERTVDRYTAGPFAGKAILVDDVPGLEAHGVDYLSAHKMTVSVWPITQFSDPDGTVHGPDFPPKPASAPPVAMAAAAPVVMAAMAVETGASASMFQPMASVSGPLTTVEVTGGGTRGGTEVGALGSSGYTWLAEDKSPASMVNIPIWIFVGTPEMIRSQVEMTIIDDSEFG